jgi:hypothetical protein
MNTQPPVPGAVHFSDEQFKVLLAAIDESRRRALTETATAPPVVEEPLNSHGLPSSWPDKPIHLFTAHEKAKYVDGYLAERVYPPDKPKPRSPFRADRA